MKTDMKLILQIASVYIGTVLGAGFASGQEIIQFFTYYGLGGIYGLIFTGLLFGVIGWAVLEITHTYQIRNFKEFAYPMMGEFIGTMMEWAVSVFLFMSFCAMLAGSGALLHQRFGIPTQVGILAMALACLIIFLYGIRGIVVANTILAPLLMVGCVLLGVYILVFRNVTTFVSASQVFRTMRHNWFSSSILYVSYNSITAVVVLTSLLPIIKNKRVAKYGGLLGGFSLGILGICLGIATLINYSDIESFEIPMLEIVMRYAPNIQYIYIFVLLGAMFTTAIANGYGFYTRGAAMLRIKPPIFMVLFLSCGILVAQMGFSNMVKKIYPLFGYIGIFQVVIIVLFFISFKIRRFKGGSKSQFQSRLNRMR